MTPDEAVDLAIERAGRYPVFPIALSWDSAKNKTNKRPLTVHGHKDATQDPDAIRRLFEAANLKPGEELGVGLWPGGGDGVVIDLDVNDAADGITVLAELEALQGALPPHPIVTTPSGGEHHYFGTDRHISNAHALGAGIDVRGWDGWVVAPGTHCTWGSWDLDAESSAPRPSCPAWLLDRLIEARNGDTPSRWEPLDRDALDQRDNEALKALEALGGHSAYAASGHVAVTRPGKRSGASATIGHIGPGVVKVFTPNWPPLAEGGVYDADQLTAMAGAPEASDYDDLYVPRSALATMQRGEPLIDGVLDRHTLFVVSGRDATYKSFIVVDWLCCLATGVDWFGREVEPTRCLYVVGEGAWGLDARIGAWEAHRGTGVTDDMLTIRKAPANLFRSGPDLDDLLFRVDRGGYGVVVFDTLRRCSAGANLNTEADAGVVVTALDRVRDATDNGAAGIVAHTDKADNDTRGSGALEDDADIVWRTKATEDGGAVRLMQAKRKDGPEDPVNRVLWPQPLAGAIVLTDRKPEGAVDPDRAPKWVHEILHELRQPALSHGASQTFLGDLLHTNKAALTRGLTWLLERDQVRKHPGPGGSYRYVATERAPGR